MQLRDFIVNALGTDAPDIEFVLPYFEEFKEKKGDFLLDSGEVCDYVYYLKKGCIINKIDEGLSPIVKEIITPHMWFSDLKSFEKRVPSQQCLECLTDVTYYRLHHRNFLELENKVPNFSRVARLVITEVNRNLEERILRLKQMTVNERWNWYQSQDRFSSFLIPKKLISEYLDMRPETLSRLLEKNKLDINQD